MGDDGRKRPRWAVGVLLCSSLLTFPAFALATSEQPQPNFFHGVGKVIGGLIFEFPRTVVEATLEGPPVVGTAVGCLAGVARALQTTVDGFAELSAGFDPWGTKRTR